MPQGAKNEALQVICAVLLTPEKVTISNIPDILDVRNLISLLTSMGVEVKKSSAHRYTFCAKDVDTEFLLTEEFRQKTASLRGSVMVIGPLLARFKKGYIPRPGGDKIGRRRLDTHFNGLISLGAKFNFDFRDDFYRVEANELHGSDMLLEEASVTGTANIIMAAVLADGKSTIYNAACEPYIQQLCKMLNCMGAKISGIGSNLI